ncbi:DUF4156 domain-containing protein [Vibrio sp. SCSIO 43135]|uniref:DUF4156 domain-containing protein n=1 Tax=Vibrio paucivorans TaxID=2829489 RepID=A0A9X3CEJ6_9VIBR|nr:MULTISPECIES: DUF4156 domain-containing protein [Vibrio]MCW8334282.1 DUF4156 domain-containing protein [Vibrio paucivorans]USD40412.1 DUF4156 domain-containing protein [Vibrio sp. SCSIO 43135]
MQKTLFALALAATTLTGCSTPVAKLSDGADSIQVRIDGQFDGGKCEWLGDLTGSEGHWYSYLFFPNDVMIRGAINDLKSQAYTMGADTLYMINPQDFATSFTVFANAYKCN